MYRPHYYSIGDVITHALQDVTAHTLIPDTNIFSPNKIGKYNGKIQFKKTLSEVELDNHRNFIKEFFNNYNVAIPPDVIKEIFPKKKTIFHQRVEKRKRKPTARKLYTGPIKAFKSRRIQLAPEGTFCDDNMIDMTDPLYLHAQKHFLKKAEKGLHGADIQLGTLTLYFNLTREVTTLISFDRPLARSVNEAWKTINLAQYLNTQDVRRKNAFLPAPNLFDYFN